MYTFEGRGNMIYVWASTTPVELLAVYYPVEQSFHIWLIDGLFQKSENWAKNFILIMSFLNFGMMYVEKTR